MAKIESGDRLYLCDRKQCGNRCSYPDCRHTTDISHAINGDTFPNGFEKVEHKDKVYFVEKEHPTMTINEYQALRYARNRASPPTPSHISECSKALWDER